DRPSDMKDLSRTLLVLPRNYPSSKYHFTMTKDGRFVETATPETAAAEIFLIDILKGGEWTSRRDLLTICEGPGHSESSVDRAIAWLVEHGQLAKRPHPDNYRERQYKLVEAQTLRLDPVIGKIPPNADN